jgi:hypothetical protein
MAFLEYQPRSTLFHYCSAAGFDGITSTGAIWISDLQHANDPKELQLAKVIDQVMSELAELETTAPELKAIYPYLQSRLQLAKSRFGMYSFSLSLRGDQLPMWQEYTDRGRGFCIGFRASAFNHMPLRVQRVRYVRHDYFGSIHSEIEEIVSPLVGDQGNVFKDIEPMTRLLSLITSVKDDTWEHEDEVRLIFSSMAKPSDYEKGETILPIGQLRDGTEVYPADPLIRERNGSQVPYFMKPFGRMRSPSEWDSSRAISQVIVGANNDRSIDQITEDLRKKGYSDFQVTRSRCAFRP